MLASLMKIKKKVPKLKLEAAVKRQHRELVQLEGQIQENNLSTI